MCGPSAVCTPGTTQACATGGSQTCQSNCQWNVCYEAPNAIATSRQDPQSVTVNSSYIYWRELTEFGATIMELPLGGGSLSTLATIGNSEPGNVLADSANLYYTSVGYCTTGGTTSASAGYVSDDPISGSGTELASSQNNPTAVAVDSQYVYWINSGTFKCSWADAGNYWYDNGYSNNNSGSIMRRPLAGGSATTLESNINPISTYAFIVSNWIAVNASYLYWTDQGGLHGMSLTGSGGPSFASGMSATIVALDGTNVYWSSPSQGTVMQMPAQGGSTITIATGQTPWGVASDGLNVYWANQGTSANNYADGAIMKAPVGGGAATQIASVTQASGYVAVDSTHVYWTVEGTFGSGNGAVWKASK